MWHAVTQVITTAPLSLTRQTMLAAFHPVHLIPRLVAMSGLAGWPRGDTPVRVRPWGQPGEPTPVLLPAYWQQAIVKSLPVIL